MDFDSRMKKVEALNKIKEKALDMENKGADALDVRNFITEAKKELAYELPDEEAFKKAMNATLAYKSSQGQ